MALSGGVDSAVAAVLLKQAGYEIRAVHLLMGETGDHGRDSDVSSVVRLAEALDLPLTVLDYRSLFRSEVLSYFVREYLKGLTPNPCVVCNPLVKFGKLLQWVSSEGIDRIASGHYARVEEGSDSEGPRLFKGVDSGKDQSYFLHRLSREQLSACLFPLGDYTKAQVRALAEKWGLRSLVRNESVEFCFAGGGDYRRLIEEFGRVLPPPGDFVLRDGSVIGRHRGIHHYTVGQRRGLGIPSTEPYYVLSIDFESNRVVLGRNEELSTAEALVNDIHWIRSEFVGERVRCEVKIRYRHRAAPAEIVPCGRSGKVRVVFEQPQRAATPGQSAVFHLGDEVLGGGFIVRPREQE